LEPVSKIRSRRTPSISSVTVGLSCSNKMEAVGLLTAFSGAWRWRAAFTHTLLVSLIAVFLSAFPFRPVCRLLTRRVRTPRTSTRVFISWRVLIFMSQSCGTFSAKMSDSLAFIAAECELSLSTPRKIARAARSSN